VGFHGEMVIGHTVEGRPVEAVHFTPPSYVQKRPPALLFGGIHGDEPSSVLMLQRLSEELIERPPGRNTWIIPCLNVDGMIGGSKNNANNVDLNRNFAAKNWRAAHDSGYHPGNAPEDQPETSMLVDLITKSGATRLIAIHATYKVMNWDGAGRQLAEQMAAACGYPAAGDIGYPTPGSFGSKYGVDLGLEVVTVEVPYLGLDEQSWIDTRAALRFAIDLPV
jgi:murein peptide amidase A